MSRTGVHLASQARSPIRTAVLPCRLPTEVEHLALCEPSFDFPGFTKVLT